MYTGDTCKICDGRGFTKDEDFFGKVTEKACTKCQNGFIHKTSNKRFFRKKNDEDTENLTLEEQTREFLRKYG